MSERVQIGLQVTLVLVVLAAAAYGIVSSVTSQPPPVAASTFTPPDASLIAETVRSPAPTPEPAPTATFATLPPSASPSPTPPPIELHPYALSGKSYTAVLAPVGNVFVAPFGARVEVTVYQLIDGEIRTGTDVAGIPSYPYIVLFTGDRTMKFRPGALGTDTEVIVQASRVNAGDPLFRVIGIGATSWHDFYDATVGAQVIVSLETSGLVDLDAKPFIKVR